MSTTTDQYKQIANYNVWCYTVWNALHVIVHDGVESVCNGDDGRVSKLCSDGLLDEVISLQVHGSCGLVQHQDLCLTEEGSSQTHQLTLTNTVGKKTKEEKLHHNHSHLRLSPPSATSCCRPFSRPDTKVLRWALSNADHTSWSVCVSKGSRFTLRVPENKTGS